MTTLQKTFDFGKIDYLENGRKSCRVTIEAELKETKKGLEFSASGNIWNQRETDIYCGGQCLDTISEYIKSPLFKIIYELWKKYHLNGMNAGTVEQTEAIKKWLEESGNKYDYSEACEYLKTINMYEVEYDGKPFKYGYGWILHEIPKHDIDEIKRLLK